MPREIKLVRIFVASPQDLGPEREALEQAVNEANRSWATRLGVRLELIRWETHSYPGFGSDAQAVINEEIGDDYDIFIGVLWARFGTSTPRAGSGTEEEFNRAYERHFEDPDSVRLMLYFKTESVAVDEVDTEQLAKVNAFKEKVRGLGGYDFSFATTDVFAELLRVHLFRQVGSWIDAQDTPVTVLVEGEEEGEIGRDEAEFGDDGEEEEGFLDAVERGTQGFEVASEISKRMTHIMKQLGDGVEARTAELRAVNPGAGATQLRQAKSIFNRQAADMETFASNLKDLLPSFKEAYSNAMDAYAKSATLVPDFKPNSLQQLCHARSSAYSLKGAISYTASAVTDMRTTIESLPRVTTRFNRGKRVSVAVLQELQSELDTATRLATTVETLIDELLCEE